MLPVCMFISTFKFFSEICRCVCSELARYVSVDVALGSRGPPRPFLGDASLWGEGTQRASLDSGLDSLTRFNRQRSEAIDNFFLYAKQRNLLEINIQVY